MVAEKPIEISEEYRKIVMQGEPIFDNSQSLVIISLKSYQDYEEAVKEKHNTEYLAKIDKGIEQMKAGKGHMHELIEAD